jgi:hypothetical protein
MNTTGAVSPVSPPTRSCWFSSVPAWRGTTIDEGELLLLHGLALLQVARQEESAEVLFRAAESAVPDAEVQLVAALACASQEWWDQAWDAVARADAAPLHSDPEMTREVEDALEAGAEAALRLLQEHLAPSILRERLLERS